MRRTRPGVFIGGAVVLVALLVIGGLFTLRRDRLPSPDSPSYEEVVRRFYRGLATLDVGLLDDAKKAFGEATMAVAGEPASWANLGLAHLRLGNFDGASMAIEKAAALAPANSDIAFLRGQLERSRGRVDEGLASFRRAIDLDPKNLRARYALAQEIEDAAGANANDQADRLLEELGRLRPTNLAVLIERARLAAKRADRGRLEESVRALAASADRWPAPVREQYEALRSAAAAGNFADAVRATAFMRNLLVRVPAFRESLAEIKPATELIAEPLRRFVKLPTPAATPSPPDEALSYTSERLAGDGTMQAGVIGFSPDGSGNPVVYALGASGLLRADGGDAPRLAFTFSPSRPSAWPIALVDWNRDFKIDVAVADGSGVRLITQSDAGAFLENRISFVFTGDSFGVWPADLEMDGDLDLIVGLISGPPQVLRNNGDGTWKTVQPFTGVADLRGFAWGDLDGDGDPDAAILDAAGNLHVYENRQAGEFAAMTLAPGAITNVVAVALSDVDGDGTLDLVTLDAGGSIRRSWFADSRWQHQPIATWTDHPQIGSPGTYRLLLADLDNNGAVDVIASGGGASRVWLAGAKGTFVPLATRIDAEVTAVADLNGDGLLDLAGVSQGQPVRLLSKGSAGYHWHVVRPRAQPTAGDQRINSFGIGGNVEIRSGLFTERQVISDPVVHFGLGTRTGVEVTRIVWPNGIMQADFDRRADETILTEQRLKGSCPWVFADDGNGMRFVTDFLWRSPLGLRINAQDTAGVTQTEDWVKIRGDQLAARHGTYDVRITAELWETHFIDHVALMSVDHPSDTEIYVDERFAKDAPALAVHITRTPAAIGRAWDDSGRDVTELVQRQDGRYLSTFELGAYQGIARDHFVDVDLGREIAPADRLWLVAAGWIYPTDSSINVAIAQGQRVRPQGLSLEAQDRAGRWVMVAPDLGFPAGKNKTILIDLHQVATAGVRGARRIRLRTNLEVYWDWLSLADSSDARPVSQRLQPDVAELRYRGFSKTDHADRRKPEIPLYGQLANVTQRWRDLVGYYTRFGDVRELIAGVDDRYVIMNAGDELRLSFAASPAPAAGWKRDFVLIGDGWEKDGDYNTTFSKTVGPLPTHARADYGASPSIELEDDPVFRRHHEDWQTYHTRFVAPHDFLNGLK